MIRIRALGIGLVDVAPSNIVRLDETRNGGALGCYVELRDGRWLYTPKEDAERLRKVM